MKLLVIEDEEKLARNIVQFMEGEKFLVDMALNGEEGLDLALSNSYDCIILDVLLPGMDGFEVCTFLRNDMKSDIPIILLTALGEVENKIKGLNIGADDYLSKPFDLRELLARVEALIRRNQLKRGLSISCGKLKINTKSQKVYCGDEQIELSKKEYQILEFLMKNSGTVFSREDIIGRLWEIGNEPRSNIVDVYIRYLRKKLEPCGMEFCIETVQGKGYRLNEEKVNDEG
jgi:DNA-binding response OmpR family regulator